MPQFFDRLKALINGKIFGDTGYRKWYLAGLVVQIIAAWFSVGYHHPDEHFQILEFCNNKLGYSPAGDLPWEYAEHCRSSILPYIALVICKGMNVLDIYDPFGAAFILRLLMGVLTWWVTVRMIRSFGSEFETEKGRVLFVASSFLLWFVPYLGVRFSSENLAGVFFFLALTSLWDIKTNDLKKASVALMFAGALLGLTLFVRLQVGFAFIGLGIWLLFVRKMSWGMLSVLVAAAIAGAGIGIGLDRLFYGEWVLTPYNYFDVNIIQHKASAWGATPWWDYFWMFFQMAVPPLSVVLLVAFIVGILKKPVHVLNLVCITMIAGHIAIGHKEMRFLFLLFPAFIFLFSRGVELITARYPGKKWYKAVFVTMVGLNMLILGIKLFMPAQESVKYYGYIYRFSKEHNTTLVALEKSPYNMDGTAGLEMNFYKPRDLKIDVLSDKKELVNILDKGDDGSYIMLSKGIIKDNELAGHSIERLYCMFPDWVLRFNFFNWQERSNIWAIYRLYPAGKKA